MRASFLAAVVLIGASCSSNGASAPTASTASTPSASTGSTAPGATPGTESSSVSSAAPTSSSLPPPSFQPGAADVGDSLYPGAGNGGYDVESYDLSLVWDPASGVLDGTATLDATATQDLSSFNLDLQSMDVSSVRVDGVVARFVHTGGELVVTPPSGLVASAVFTTTVVYSGIPGASSFGGWLRDGNGGVVAFGEPEVAAYWYPVNDHPLDKASYTIHISAPSELTVASNGTLIDQIDNGTTTTWTYSQPAPQASYLTTLAIGGYEIVDAGTSASGIPIRNVFPRDSVAKLTETFARQPAMIDVFENLFGPYPFDVYGALVLDNLGFGSALENQTLSVFTTGVTDESVQVHELAHQWFGDSVSLADWADIWLNEGFATYAELLWSESQDPAFNTSAEINQWRLQADLDQPITQLEPTLEGLFTASVYRRGAMLLHALRLEIGDKAFFETLRTYVKTYAYGNVTTADFIAIAEQTAGQQLDDLFDRWLNDVGLPTF